MSAPDPSISEALAILRQRREGESAPAPAGEDRRSRLLRAAQGLRDRELAAAQDGARLGAQQPAASAGRARELATQLGVPQDVAERNLPALEQEKRVRDLPWGEIERSRAMRDFLADPARAPAVLDDVGSLLRFRRALEVGPVAPPLPPLDGNAPPPRAPELPPPALLDVLGARFESGRRTAFDIPNAAGPMIWSALGWRREPATFEERRAWQEVQSRPIGPTRRAGVLDDILGAPLEQLPVLARTAKGALSGSVLGAGLGAGAGAALGGVGAGPGALLGIPAGAKAGSALSAFIVESGNAFAEFQGITDENGQPIDEQTAAAGAVVVGAINAGLEVAAFQSIVKVIPGADRLFGAGREVVSSQVMRQMRQPALRATLLAAARKIGGALGAEVSTEVAQEAVNIEAGRVIDPTREAGLPTREELGRLGETAVQTALGVIPLVGIGAGVGARMDRIAQARQGAAQLAAAREAVAEAGVRQISPQAFAQLSGELAAEAGIEDVRIPARALLEQYEAAGGSVQDLVADVPEAAAQLEEALATGGDVRVPAGRYFAALDPRFGDAIAQDVRLRPEDLTIREADTAEQALPEQIEREMALEMAAAEASGETIAPAPSQVEVAPAPAGADVATSPEATPAAPAAPGPFDWAIESIRKAKTKSAVGDTLALVRAQDALGLQGPLFSAPIPGLMAPGEFEAIQEAHAKARTAAQEQVARELSTERLEAARAARAERRTLSRARRDFRREVAAEVDRSPVEQARAFLTLRVDSEAAPQQRLDRDVLRSYGQSPYGGRTIRGGQNWADVVPKGMQQVGGLHPDSVAELFGFQSGIELVNALASEPSRADAIASGTDARMTARFGDLEQRHIEGAIQDAAANDAQFRALLAEERVLARLAGRGGGKVLAADRQAIQAGARRLIARRAVKDIRPEVYRDQARRARLAAVEAVGQQDYPAAHDQYRAQLLNLALESEARAVRTELEKAQRVLAKVARNKTTRTRIARAAKGEYLRQIDRLLERHGLRAPVPGGEGPAAPLAKWVSDLESAGAEVVASERLLDERQGAPWRELSVQDARDLRDAVRNQEELATREGTLTRGREKLQLQGIAERIIERIEEQGLRSKEPQGFTPTRLEELRAHGRGIDASLRKAEFVIDALAGDDPNSVLRRTVWEPLRDAQGAYNEKLAKYSQGLAQLRDARGEKVVADWGKALPETRLKRKDGTAYPLTKWNVVMLALNMGNASNMQKLLGGYGWDRATVEAVLDKHLDADDWRFIQGTWDLIDSLWPEVSAMEKRLTGVAPPKIEAQTVRTRFGDFRGGYFPVVYDANRSQFGQRAEASQLVPGLSEGFTRASTGHGHTEQRTQVKGPLRLDPNVIATHLDQVILDLTHREALIDAQRILGRPDVDAAISKALGREFGFRDFWLPRLRAVARDTADPGAMRSWQAAARWVRQRGTVFKLGFRLSTLLSQASGHFNGLRAIQQQGGSVSDWAHGVWEGLGGLNPTRAKDTYRRVYDSSPFMRDRARSSNQELREILRKSKPAGVSQAVADFALRLIGEVQLRMVDMPVWLAAHRSALRRGETEVRAVRAADAAVSKSQGGGTRLDQSLFESSESNPWRMLTLFYSYNNAVYNQLFRKGNIGGARLADYAMYVLGPGLFSAALHGILNGEAPDPDDPKYEQKMARTLARIAVGEVAGTLPVVRDVWPVAVGENPRIASAPDILLREGQDLLDPKDGTDFMFDAMRAGGLAAGLPADWLLRTAERLAREEQ